MEVGPCESICISGTILLNASINVKIVGSQLIFKERQLTYDYTCLESEPQNSEETSVVNINNIHNYLYIYLLDILVDLIML